MRKYIGPFLFLYLNGQMSKEGNRKPNPACRIWHYILKSEKPNLQKWAVSEDFCLPTRFCCRRWVKGHAEGAGAIQSAPGRPWLRYFRREAAGPVAYFWGLLLPLV